MRSIFALGVIAFVLAGCSQAGVSEADQAGMRQEFSKDSYEKAMIDSGRGAELEAEKKKEAAFMQGNANDGSSQDPERE